MAAAIDYDQQNRIRLALGLKPLPVPGAASTTATAAAGPTFKSASTSSSSDSDSDDDEEPASTLERREAASYDNWKKVQEEAEAKKRRAAKAEAIKKARDAAQKFIKLQGKGLGDVDGDGDHDVDADTRSWLLGAKKRQKKLERERARRMEVELVERERLAAVEYGAKDLVGVKVGHEIEEFGEREGEAGGQVLTLKDATIEENEEEGDELENVEMKERELLRERLELKKRKPVYDPHSVDEGSGERKVLAQYDEEIEGKKRKRFVLDGQGSTVEERQAKRQEIGERLRKQPISLDFFKEEPKSDYMEVWEVKMKKPKKSKKKAARQRAMDDDDIFPQRANGEASNHDTMDLDGVASKPNIKPKEAEKDFADDEDLQASLAAQRRIAFKKRKRQRPEDIARQIQDEGSASPNDVHINGEGAEDEPGLVIDETSEFVANLQRPTVLDQKLALPAHKSVEHENHAGADEAEDVDMKETYNGVEDEEELLARLRREQSSLTPELTTTGLEAEATMDQGVGAAFNLLKQRGLIKTADMGDINALHRDRQRFLAEKQRREAEAEHRARLQRERDRTSGKLERMSAREREEHARWENKQRDQLESRQMADIFNREYKPDVQLKYIDEHGRSMNQKEAFKHLSHQFHGKGSGKQKTEKHLKKIEDEKKREAMSTLDASQATGMNNAMGTTQKKNKQAGVRLG